MRAVVFALVPLAGCAAEPVLEASRSIDISAATDGRAVRGLSVDGDLLDLVVEEKGLVQIDREGNVVREIAPGAQGLWRERYNDVAARGNDVFVLLSDNEGYLYDAVTEQQRVHFCVEPGFEPEPEPTEPVIEQRNDAVALTGNIIIAAPRFYQDGELTESSLRTYRASDGVQIDSVDHTDLRLELTGLARLTGETILGVQRDELHEFSLDGEHVGVSLLDGVDDASGLAVDGDELLVADGDRILVFVR